MPEGFITALQAQERDSQRVNVFIDGVFALGISLNTLAREELYIGKPIDAAQWTRLQAAESADKALQAALRFLQARPRSIAEVRTRLEQKQYAAEAIEDAIARLADLNLLDDLAFARFWVENRQACRPRGVQALRDELYRKGIARTIIDEVVSDEHLVGDERERAFILARAALPKYANVSDRVTFQRRLGGYLQRRGFDYETIKPILDRLWREVEANDDEYEQDI